MNFSLFGQNLVTACAMIFASMLAYLAFAPWLNRPAPAPKDKGKRKSKAPEPLKIPRRKLARLLAAAALGAFFVQGLAVHFYPGEELPTIFFMALPAMLGISAVIWVWGTRKWYDRALGFGLIAVGLLVGLVALNDYYHYYPTLADAFNLHSHQRIANIDNQTVVRYSSSKSSSRPVLETSLQDLSGLPAKGQVYSLSVLATASRFNARKGWLYAPPAAFSPQKVNLPVLVLLAGSPGGPNDWLNGGGAIQTLDTFAAQHHGVAPLVVFVDDEGNQNGDTECVDSARGNVETYLTVDVPNYLKANFDVTSDASGWGIGGLSDGGMCGVMIALRHPDVYREFLDLGGGMGPHIGTQLATISTLFHGSQEAWQSHQPLYLLQHLTSKDNGSGGYFAAGSSDSSDIVSAVQTLYHQSVASGLDVAYESTEGRHTFAVWQQQFHDALPWLSYHLGATTCSSQCY